VTQLYSSISYNNPVKNPPIEGFLYWPLASPTAVPYIYNSVSLSASVLVSRLSKTSLSRNRSKIDSCVGIDICKLFLPSLYSYNYYTLWKCMNQSFQEFLLIIMQLSIGKMIKSINSTTGFQNRILVLKPKTGFPVFD